MRRIAALVWSPRLSAARARSCSPSTVFPITPPDDGLAAARCMADGLACLVAAGSWLTRSSLAGSDLPSHHLGRWPCSFGASSGCLPPDSGCCTPACPCPRAASRSATSGDLQRLDCHPRSVHPLSRLEHSRPLPPPPPPLPSP